jgi:hypothetical protein
MSLLMFTANHTIPTALTLLPPKMDTPAARAMLIAIGLQESRFLYRRQMHDGPARGAWQFERMGGVAGVLDHQKTAPLIAPICELLRYPAEATACHVAIEHNDVLATCFARLLLWTDPRALPSASEAGIGWQIYVNAWRPGKPHQATWADNFAHAWQTISGT